MTDKPLEQNSIEDVFDHDWNEILLDQPAVKLDPLRAIVDRLETLLATLEPKHDLHLNVREANHEGQLIRRTRSALPDPRLIRNLLKARQMRSRFFGVDLFADPAWDMLLDLSAARVEHRRVSVTSLCIASGVPNTTALRWMKLLERAGLIERIEDDTDRRRAFVALTEAGASAVARYFDTVTKQW